jgi:hypothetical protein
MTPANQPSVMFEMDPVEGMNPPCLRSTHLVCLRFGHLGSVIDIHCFFMFFPRVSVGDFSVDQGYSLCLVYLQNWFKDESEGESGQKAPPCTLLYIRSPKSTNTEFLQLSFENLVNHLL